MNNYSQDIEDLKASFDQVQIVCAELQARVMTLTSMFLGVYKETLPADQYKVLYTNYVLTLQENFSNVLEGLDDTLFDQKNLLLRLKFDLFEAIEHLKRDSDFVSNSTDTHT